MKNSWRDLKSLEDWKREKLWNEDRNFGKKANLNGDLWYFMEYSHILDPAC